MASRVCVEPRAEAAGLMRCGGAGLAIDKAGGDSMSARWASKNFMGGEFYKDCAPQGLEDSWAFRPGYHEGPLTLRFAGSVHRGLRLCSSFMIRSRKETRL